ncbi:MAG: hypothetical protein ACRDS0_19530 [Pseudonocardiaceae bacterium]
MSPKRGDRAAPPHGGDEYDIRFDNAESAKGWDELAPAVPANLRRAFDTIRATPRPIPSTERHHRLRGSLSTASAPEDIRTPNLLIHLYRAHSHRLHHPPSGRRQGRLRR